MGRTVQAPRDRALETAATEARVAMADQQGASRSPRFAVTLPSQRSIRHWPTPRRALCSQMAVTAAVAPTVASAEAPVTLAVPAGTEATVAPVAASRSTWTVR